MTDVETYLILKGFCWHWAEKTTTEKLEACMQLAFEEYWREDKNNTWRICPDTCPLLSNFFFFFFLMVAQFLWRNVFVPLQPQLICSLLKLHNVHLAGQSINFQAHKNEYGRHKHNLAKTKLKKPVGVFSASSLAFSSQFN